MATKTRTRKNDVWVVEWQYSGQTWTPFAAVIGEPNAVAHMARLKARWSGCRFRLTRYEATR